jgi:signal transduction histidine kinase
MVGNPMEKSRSKPKFLLVDDLEQNLLALEAVLRRDDVELHRATSGRDALELLLAHEFALAIIDVQMPEMDGFELAELMRGNDRTRLIPIIFVTAGGRDGERTFRGYEAGAVDFLFKPLDPRILRHKVDVFLRLFLQRVELERTLRLNEELLAIVTHDLRSPLASILMVAEVLAKQNKDEAVLRHAERVRRTSRQLINIVNELLDLSRARLAGGIPVDRREVDLAPLVARIVNDMAAANPGRTIELKVPDKVEGRWDGARLEQVVQNLVGNAISHGSAGAPIGVTLKDAGEEVELSVKNEGTIPDGMVDVLFEPFTQGYSKRKGSALGLGLYIVDQIVLAHGGTVTVQTGPEGTTFTVRMPKRGSTPP